MSSDRNIDQAEFSDDRLKAMYGEESIKVLLENLQEEDKVKEILQIDLNNLDLLLSQPIETLEIILEKQLILVGEEQILTTLRWKTQQVNKIRKLKERWTKTLTVCAAVLILKLRAARDDTSSLSDYEDTEEDKEEEDPLDIFLNILRLKLDAEKSEKDLNIDKEKVVIDVDKFDKDSLKNQSLNLKKSDHHSDRRQISDNAKLIYNQIPNYNYEDDPVIIQQFIRKVGIWEKLILHHQLLDSYTMYTLLVVKLGELAVNAMHDEIDDINTVAGILDFIKKVKKVANQSDDARKRMYQVRQKSGQTPREYYLILLEVNGLIENHSLKVKQFQEAYINGLNNYNLKMRVKEWHDVYKVEHDSEIPPTDRLIAQVEIISKGIKPSDNHSIPAFKPRISSLSGFNIGEAWDEKFKHLQLATTPGLRELLTKLGRCHLCREENCAGIR